MGSQRRQGQDKERLRLTSIAVRRNKDKAIMLGGKLMVLQTTDQIRELQTMIRDKVTSRSEFKFVADRLIRMVVEEGLNQLPYQDIEVVTPTGCKYSGLKYGKGNCGVAIGRSGEAMEKALQDCCRSMRIGKILIDSDSDTETAHVVFAKFMEDIADRKVDESWKILSHKRKPKSEIA